LAVAAGFVGTGFASDQLGTSFLAVALAVAPSIIGAIVWQLESAPALATAAWVIPLAVLSLFGTLIPSPIGPAIQLGAVGVLVLMLFSPGANTSWVKFVDGLAAHFRR
jgi:hypothetical protein